MPNENYTIIWKHFEKNSGIGTHLKALKKFSLPYFIDGIDKERFENKQPTDLHVVHLIKGLLVGYFDAPPNEDTTFAQQNTKQILAEHLDDFKSGAIEDLILDFAADLRNRNGQEASFQALMAGVEVVPDSSAIKYDCALDLYNCLENDVLKDNKAGEQKLVELLNSIDVSKLNQELRSDYEWLRNEKNR